MPRGSCGARQISLDHDLLSWPARAEQSFLRWIADPKRHDHLPARIGKQRGDRPRELRLEPRRLLTLSTLDHLIQRLHRYTLSCGPQVHALPGTPSIDALCVVAG